MVYKDRRLAAINNGNSQQNEEKYYCIIPKGSIFNHHRNKPYSNKFCGCYLPTEKYFPFQKAKNTPRSINAFSNDLPTIITQLLKVINKKTSDLFYNNRKCNCRSIPTCPLNSECETRCLAICTTSNNSIVYYWTSKGEFKTR